MKSHDAMQRELKKFGLAYPLGAQQESMAGSR